jgi:signal transduction histidine kinase
VKKLSQRVAGLTPSITLGLILLAVGLTALLAYRAFDASRAQQQLTANTLRDYAGFAAFQLKNATINRVTGQPRAAFDGVIRSINSRGPIPPLGPERAKSLMEERGSICRCLDSVSFYFQLTFADSAISATASALATPENLRRIRDTVVTQSLTPGRLDPPLGLPTATPSSAPITSHSLVSIFSSLGDRPYMFTYALTVNATGRPIIAYGFAVPAEYPVGRTVKGVLASQAILPSSLTRGMRTDSMLAVTVTSADRKLIFESNPAVAPQYAATDSVAPQFGGLRFQVAIDPAAAERLIIGGLPRSRLPEVLATALVAVGLLGLLLYQFRRQEELGRLRDDFVSGVSHELRTPLAQIRLLAELLHMERVPAEEKQRSLRIIDQEARRLSFLVDSILSFSHSPNGTLAPVSTDVATEIGEIVSGFEPLAQAQGVRLTTRLANGIVAEVDRGALRQVLLNLLDNAVRYGPPRQNVTITTSSAADTWTLEVADEGPGVPADEREKIFAPYYRMKRDAGGAVGGTGIGLAVVRRLVEEHRGQVHVANGNGTSGARFVVSLPIASPPAN